MIKTPMTVIVKGSYMRGQEIVRRTLAVVCLGCHTMHTQALIGLTRYHNSSHNFWGVIRPQEHNNHMLELCVI